MRKGALISGAGFLSLLLLASAVVLIDKALFWRSQRDEILQWAKLGADNTQPPNRPAVLFIGNSIMADFPLKLAFHQHCQVINKGVDGDGIREVAQRYGLEVEATPHDYVVIEGGINDILGCVSENRDEKAIHRLIIDEYRRLLELAQERGKKVMVLEILPVTRKFFLPYMKAVPLPTALDVKRTNRLIRDINDDLRRLCTERRAVFIPTHAAIADGQGDFRRDFAAADGYHVNVSGYKALTSAIEPFLD